jgi:hypothetical protein
MKLSVLRRLVTAFIVLACLYFPADRIASYGLDQVVKQSGFRLSKLYSGGLNPDILIFGNSRAVNAFYAPDLKDQLDQSVFHLGYNGMSTELCEAIFLDYLDYNAKPALVVFEVTNLSVSNDLIKDLKLYAGLSPRLRSVIERDDPRLNTICSVSHLYRYNCELFLRSLYYLGKSDQAWINSGNIDPDFAVSFIPTEEDQADELYPTAGTNWDALQRVIKKCNSEGIELRLVASPYLPAFRNHLNDYEPWVNSFRSALTDPELFYDYSQGLSGSIYFADVLHINRKGSRALLDIMIQDGIFNVEQP